MDGKEVEESTNTKGEKAWRLSKHHAIPLIDAAMRQAAERLKK